MTSYRRSTPLTHLACARDSGGAYDPSDPTDHNRDAADSGPDRDDRGRAPNGPARDPDDPGPAAASPLGRMAELLDELEDVKRRVLAGYRDVAAWGGTAKTTGYTHSEWMALVGRVPGREAWKLDLLTSRLPACPVTAALLDRGALSFDQAVTILSGTKRLSGDTLADVERAAAEAAQDRNRRGDDPDMDADVEALVQRTRKAAEQDRTDRDRLERNSVRIQPDLFGAGRIVEDWADPEGFQTRVAALDHAAGQPSPDIPRGQQLAEGSLAMARAWLAGTTHHPLLAGSDTDDFAAAAAAAAAGLGGPTEPDDVDPADVDPWLLDTLDQPELPTSPDQLNLGPSAARPTLLVRIDIRDLNGIDPTDPDTLRWLGTGSDAAFARLATAGRLATTPWLGRQLTDTLACNADLLVAIVDGERPLAEFKRPSRLPDRIRRQILWRDLGCRWPGCRAPVAHCDVHHLDGDPTNHDVDNLGGFCRKHHIRLHSTFWHWRLDGHTGRFDLLRTPDGQPVHTTYPRGTHPQLRMAGGDPPGVA